MSHPGPDRIMEKPTTVLVIRSLSYTGTTWINLLLGCHARTFALGPPNRILDLLERDDPVEDREEACRVHGPDCPFWSRFASSYDRSGNFYRQLASAAGRDIIIINNPTPGGRADRHLRHPLVMVKQMTVVRDGRAVVASYGRYHPEADFCDTVKDWFQPFAAALTVDQHDPDVLFVRYEDVVEDQWAFIRQAGEFLGLDYPEGFYRFWEFDHHPTSGNPGPVGTVSRHQGRPFRGPDRAEREDRYQRLIADPARPPFNPRWEQEWGERGRLIFDYFAGAINEAWGYPRDRFTTAQVREFEEAIGEAPPIELSFVPKRRLADALRPAILRNEGLHLIPGQVRRLAQWSLAGFLIVLLVAVIGALIF